MAVSHIKAKVGSIVKGGKGKLPELLGKKINRYFDEVQKLIIQSMNVFGETIKNEVRMELMSSTGSGRRYKYVDKDGETLFEWTASAPENIPAAVSGKLANSIDYRIFSDKEDSLGEFTIGIWSNQMGGLYPTVAFKGGPSRTKKGELKKGEEEGVGKLFVVEGQGSQTSLRSIAKYLEEGTSGKHPMEPRPFLTPLFEKNINKYKIDIGHIMHQALLTAMGKTTLPVYFRFYIRENK